MNKKVKARNGQQSKCEPWVEVLFCCPAICWTFSSARLLRYVQRQPGVISDRFYSSCSYSLHWFNSAKQHFCDISYTQCKCEKEEVIFLTRSEFFLLSASAYPVTQLDGSITHDCLTRIRDFGFHRFENQNRSIQRGWKCSRVDNNRSIPAQYNSQWFMLKDISRFSFLDLERAFKEYRFPRKAV